MVPPEPAVNSDRPESCPAPPLNRFLTVDGVLQALAGLELGLGGFPDLHRFPGTRIPARRRLAPRAGKGTEADQAHLVTALQSAGDRVEDRFDRPRSIPPSETRHLGDVSDKLLLVHFSRTPVTQ